MAFESGERFVRRVSFNWLCGNCDGGFLACNDSYETLFIAIWGIALVSGIEDAPLTLVDIGCCTKPPGVIIGVSGFLYFTRYVVGHSWQPRRTRQLGIRGGAHEVHA